MTPPQIPRYHILGLLAEGGMGRLYRAADRETGRQVAIKVLPAALADDRQAKGRFLREAILSSAVDHPNVCRPLDSGETGAGEIYMVMEQVRGRTLLSVLALRDPSRVEALEIAAQLASGLAAAHEKRIVHRDIKPSNLMLTPEGVVKILDFGLARFQAARPIGTGEVLGSVPYAAPEQMLDNEPDHRVDLWSLGVVLYEMLAGTTPFRGGDRQTVAQEVLERDAEPLGSHCPDAPPELERLLSRLLSRDPQLRFGTAEEVLHELELQLLAARAAADRGEPERHERERGWMSRLRRRLRRRRGGKEGSTAVLPSRD